MAIGNRPTGNFGCPRNVVTNGTRDSDRFSQWRGSPTVQDAVCFILPSLPMPSGDLSCNTESLFPYLIKISTFSLSLSLGTSSELFHASVVDKKHNKAASERD